MQLKMDMMHRKMHVEAKRVYAKPHGLSVYKPTSPTRVQNLVSKKRSAIAQRAKNCDAMSTAESFVGLGSSSRASRIL